MCHHDVLAGHPGQNRMYETMRLSYYWPAMAADITATVERCQACARNRLKLRRHANSLKLFPASAPLEEVSIDLLGPLPKTKKGNLHLLGIICRFTKLTQVVTLRSITAYHVAFTFCTHWAVSYTHLTLPTIA